MNLVTTASAGSGAQLPTVSGPVTGGQHGWPFAAFLGDIAQWGYVEEEYFIGGEATSFRSIGELKNDGKWSVKPDGTVPYQTRILVRRPKNPAQFNGTVLVEWLNVTLGHDIAMLGEGVLRDGFAYVGVSCQYVAVNGFENNANGLRQWDAERYGNLSLPAESMCYDIYSQAARAVGPQRLVGRVDPMGGLDVKKLIAVGMSQSAARLLSYANALQREEKVFDALVLTVVGDMASGFDDTVMDFSKGVASAMSALRARSSVRDDLQTPVMIVNSESESSAYLPLRRPDTSTFVYWEVAGSAHGPQQMSTRLNATFLRDGLGSMPAPKELSSTVDWGPVADAAYFHVNQWINGGAAPPTMPTIEFDGGGVPAIRRDPHGNALGGIRLPELEVPVARYSGHASGGEISGSIEPFGLEKIRSLYPDAADFVAQGTRAARAAEQAGVIRPWRTQEYVQMYEASNNLLQTL